MKKLEINCKLNSFNWNNVYFKMTYSFQRHMYEFLMKVNWWCWKKPLMKVYSIYLRFLLLIIQVVKTTFSKIFI